MFKLPSFLNFKRSIMKSIIIYIQNLPKMNNKRSFLYKKY